MPKLTKRRWNTCGCRKGEAPESSCVFHGVGSYLVLLQFTRVGEERHVVVGAAHTPRMSNHYVGELYGIETLCDRKMPVIVPWGREANEGTYEEQHRALVETELLEGDGRYNQLSTQLGVDSPTCSMCLRELVQRGGLPEVQPPACFTRMVGEAMHLLRYSDRKDTRCGTRRKVPGPCQLCFSPAPWQWVSWKPEVLTPEEWDRREGLHRMLHSYLEGFGWVWDPSMGWSHPCLGGRRRVGYRDDRALECQLSYVRREMAVGRPRTPRLRLPASRFERDPEDA